MKLRFGLFFMLLLKAGFAVEPSATLTVTRVTAVTTRPFVALHSLALTRPCAPDTVMGVRWRKIMEQAQTNSALALTAAHVWASDYDRLNPSK